MAKIFQRLKDMKIDNETLHERILFGILRPFRTMKLRGFELEEIDSLAASEHDFPVSAYDHIYNVVEWRKAKQANAWAAFDSSGANEETSRDVTDWSQVSHSPVSSISPGGTSSTHSMSIIENLNDIKGSWEASTHRLSDHDQYSVLLCRSLKMSTFATQKKLHRFYVFSS